MTQQTNLPLWKELRYKFQPAEKMGSWNHAEIDAHEKYKNLAEENLHILAEALEKAFAWNESIAQLAAENRLDVESLSRNTQLIQSVIKNALNKVS